MRFGVLNAEPFLCGNLRHLKFSVVVCWVGIVEGQGFRSILLKDQQLSFIARTGRTTTAQLGTVHGKIDTKRAPGSY